MNLINLTPQPITFLSHDDKPVATIKPSGILAKVAVTGSIDEHVNANGHMVPVSKTTYGDPSPLPAEKPGTLYITSTLYRVRNPRNDLVSPGPLKRDEDGNPIGCYTLIR